MYAIVEIAGQQFRVEKNDEIVALRVQGDEGAEVEFEKVMLLSDKKATTVGTPFIEGAKVKATIVGHGKDKTVRVFKKKRRKGYEVLNGHRQPITTLQIKEIVS